jgi:F0F1-type ATP synthase beta subunit
MVSSIHSTPTVFIPGDAHPAPPLLTGEQACRLLLLELSEGQDPLLRLQHYRQHRGLLSVPVGKETRFRLVDVLDLVDRLQEESKHSPVVKTSVTQRATKASARRSA